MEAELARYRAHGITVLSELDADYPANLRHIHDPPGALFCCGSYLERDTLGMAVVGTRHATYYGRRQAERLAAGLSSAGLTIVSGLARGIDASAHRAALATGGRTIAVLGSGLLRVYPPEHAELAVAISQAGAVLSEVRPSNPPHNRPFRSVIVLSLGSAWA